MEATYFVARNGEREPTYEAMDHRHADGSPYFVTLRIMGPEGNIVFYFRDAEHARSALGAMREAVYDAEARANEAGRG